VSEIFNGINTLNLRNEGDHITIHPRKNPILFKKLLNNFANICPNNLPSRMKENTTKTIRTRGTITIKNKNNILDFQIIQTFNQHNIILRRNHGRNVNTNNVSIRIRINIDVFVKFQNMILNELRILSNNI